ncbi:MAG: hypothetical protein AB7G68_16490 [Nitrospiraceae bacterium]
MTEPQDPRWGDYIPWFMRHGDLPGIPGERWESFFNQVGHRLSQVVLYNEAGTPDRAHFGDKLASATHLRFPFDRRAQLHSQLETFFDPEQIRSDINMLVEKDAEVRDAARQLEASNLGFGLAPLRSDSEEWKFYISKKKEKRSLYQQPVIRQRLTVLEECLRLIGLEPNAARALPSVVCDIRRYMAETGIPFDIASDPVLIRPLDEPLLDGQVIQRLLPRLAERYPDLESDLVKAYHDLLQGMDTNTVFGNAFKVLEELTNRLTGDKILLSNDRALQRHFPKLHGTIHTTIIKLASHRGDEGGHHRQGPDQHEMRYLLFCICNIALLLLEYPRNSSGVTP